MRPLGYTRTQIVLHWLVAGLVLLQYSTSGAIVRTHSVHMVLGQRPNTTDLILHTIHNRVGLTIVALTVGRLALRLWVGTPPPAVLVGGLAARSARAVHAAFYAVLIAEGVTGAVATYFWWPISSAHVILFYILLVLLTIHVAAALCHRFICKDDVLGRVGFKQLFTGRDAS